MNQKMKKIIPAILIATMISAVFITSAYAGTTDTFTVTVRGKYLDIQVNRTTWSINSDAAIEMSSIYYSNVSTTPYFTAVLYNNSMNVDLKLHVSSDGVTWSDGTTPGADAYRLNATADLWVGEINLNNVAAIVAADITLATNQTFDLRFDAPTSTTTGDLQTLTVMATVAEH